MARVLYQLVAPLDITIGPHEPARRAAFLNASAGSATDFVVRPAARARGAIEGAWDAAIAAPSIIDGIVAAEAEGFDAAIVGCFSDPALDAVREAVAMPVVGPGASSVHLALQIGERVGVLTPGAAAAPRTRAFFRRMGLEDRLGSVRGVGLSVEEMARAGSPEGREPALTQVVRAAERAIGDGADVLVLGCMSMAFLDPTEAIAERVGAPVINPVLAAAHAAQSLLSMGLTHSRTRWPAAAHRPIVTSQTVFQHQEEER